MVGLAAMACATGWAWEWNKVCLFGCLGLFNLLCLLVLACCLVGLAAMVIYSGNAGYRRKFLIMNEVNN